MTAHYILTSQPGTRYYFGAFLRPQPIAIGWVAHSLAQLNRYVGHAVRPISVAEHSLLCVEIGEREFGINDPAALLALLLHDAHEATVGDASAPLKAYMRGVAHEDNVTSPYDYAEACASRELRTAFGLLSTFAGWRTRIHHIDMVALATEARDLMPPDPDPWPCLAGIEPVTWVDLRSRDGMTWLDWRQAFIDRFEELAEARRIRGEAISATTPQP